MDHFKKYSPEELLQLAYDFRREATANPGLNAKARARGSHLLKVSNNLWYRIRAGAAYVDQNPDDTRAAILYHQLVEAQEIVYKVLKDHWIEDYRLSIAKILFDAEEEHGFVSDEGVGGITPAGGGGVGGITPAGGGGESPESSGNGATDGGAIAEPDPGGSGGPYAETWKEGRGDGER
jgi:hypothetical protein